MLLDERFPRSLASSGPARICAARGGSGSVPVTVTRLARSRALTPQQVGVLPESRCRRSGLEAGHARPRGPFPNTSLAQDGTAQWTGTWRPTWEARCAEVSRADSAAQDGPRACVSAPKPRRTSRTDLFLARRPSAV